jgi:serine/threonine protein phosphatase PrpC
VRSFLQISRSIGDVYLKKPEYNREPLHSKFRLRETFQRPILSSEPQITEHRIQPNDQFVIFASDGLWEHLSNKEAVDLVQSSPRNVCFLLSHYNFYELKSTFFLALVTVPSNWLFHKYILWIMLCFYWIAILLN